MSGAVPRKSVCRVAQESSGFRTQQRRNPVTGPPTRGAGLGVVNQYYFYCVDEEFGPVCVKFSGYSLYRAADPQRNEYAKRQAPRRIGFVPLTTRSPSMTGRGPAICAA